MGQIEDRFTAFEEKPENLSFEEVCELGRLVRAEMDNWRWTLGEIASYIQIRWEAGQVETFAIQCGLAKKTVEQYRYTYRFYEKDARVAFCETHLLVFYSHFRLAAYHFESERLAFEFLERCNDEPLTIEQAQLELRPSRGGEPILESPILTFMGNPERLGLEIGQLNRETIYRMEIYEISGNKPPENVNMSETTRSGSIV